MILVADGAGIIGVNFVVDWLAQQPDEAVNAKFLYKTTNYYWASEFERSIAWNDDPTLSAKDKQANPLAKAEHFA